MRVEFDQWIQGRHVQTLGTNAGAEKLPFQTWRNFKEAFAPELIARAVEESNVAVKKCIDPFGGSGTTALACQFLGIEPVTIEVNPYLADLIEAKLSIYDGGALSRDLGKIIRSVRSVRKQHDLSWLPPTFVAPGVNQRWLFEVPVAQRIESYRIAIESLENPSNQTFYRALLGGFLVEVSNVSVSGKGRRYRKNWQARPQTAERVDSLFLETVQRAIYEVVRYSHRPNTGYTLIRGDSRTAIAMSPKVDLAVFSPPYPNSFDYTDVYNVELWMLGYLKNSASNRALRQATLASHVQIQRDYAPRPVGSVTLDDVSDRLHSIKDQLWSNWIPNMVDSYFADMGEVMKALCKRLNTGGEAWGVVGDSLYGNVAIPVAGIMAELASKWGFEIVRIEEFRSMRTSAQQGGRRELAESLIVLRKTARPLSTKLKQE